MVLHHARSLAVPLRHIFGGGQPDAARTSAQIDQRWQDAHRRYHACRIEIVVHADDSVPLWRGAGAGRSGLGRTRGR